MLQEGQRRRVDPNSSRLGPVWGGVHLWGETQRVTSSWICKNIRKTMQHTASYSKLLMRFLNEDSFLPKKPFWLFHTRGFCICRLAFFFPSLCFFFLAGLEWAVLSSLSKTKKKSRFSNIRTRIWWLLLGCSIVLPLKSDQITPTQSRWNRFDDFFRVLNSFLNYTLMCLIVIGAYFVVGTTFSDHHEVWKLWKAKLTVKLFSQVPACTMQKKRLKP